MRKLAVGDVIEYRYYNTPDKHFYGPVYVATIMGTEHAEPKPFFVKRNDGYLVNLQRKEIKRRIGHVDLKKVDEAVTAIRDAIRENSTLAEMDGYEAETLANAIYKILVEKGFAK